MHIKHNVCIASLSEIYVLFCRINILNISQIICIACGDILSEIYVLFCKIHKLKN